MPIFIFLYVLVSTCMTTAARLDNGGASFYPAYKRKPACTTTTTGPSLQDPKPEGTPSEPRENGGHHRRSREGFIFIGKRPKARQGTDHHRPGYAGPTFSEIRRSYRHTAHDGERLPDPAGNCRHIVRTCGQAIFLQAETISAK